MKEKGCSYLQCLQLAALRLQLDAQRLGARLCRCPLLGLVVGQLLRRMGSKWRSRKKDRKEDRKKE